MSEKGPLPGLQIAPVARCRLQMALVFQVPWVLWLRPIVQQLMKFSASPIQRAAVRMSSAGMPVISLTVSGVYCSRKLGHHLPALGEFGDEFGVGVPVLDDQVQQPVEQREIGAGGDLQEQVGLLRGRGAARVDDDQFCAGLDAVHHPQEQDRMAVGHVGADDEEDVGLFEVLVRAGRSVRAQGQLVAGTSAGHAQSRVRLDLVGADEALWSACSPSTAPRWTSGPTRTERRHPGRAASMIARNRFAHWVIAVSMSIGSRGSPRSARTYAESIRPGRGEHVRGGGTLGAQPAEVGRMFFVSNRLRDVTALAFGIGCDLQHHSAADAAVSAHGVHGVVVGRHGLPGHAYFPPSSATRLTVNGATRMFRHRVSGCFPRFTASSHRTDVRGEVSGKAAIAPGQRGHRRPATNGSRLPAGADRTPYQNGVPTKQTGHSQCSLSSPMCVS